MRIHKREERERIQAEKKAERQRKLRDKENTSKAVQTSQTGKRKASKPLAKKQKKQTRVEVAAEDRVEHQGAVARDPSPVITSRRGRYIKLPQKLK